MKIGFIGTGNMGGAILRGYVAGNPAMAKSIYAYDASASTLNQVVADTGVNSCSGAKEVAKEAELLLLAVKPDKFVKVLTGVKEELKKEQLIVSIVSGISMEEIESIAGKEAKIIRVMPNTPAMVNEGMASLSRNGNVTDEELGEVAKIFDAVGISEELDEKLIPAVIAVSGSSPAYVYMFIEALADAAVKEGMPRSKAYRFAAQAVKGSAEMVLKTGRHPGELKDMVCSPGGNTIEAVRILEERGMRSAVMEAAHGAAVTTAMK